MGDKGTVIGISPGTTNLGFAVFRCNTLVDYGVKIYTGKWSKNKLSHILNSVGKLIEHYTPETVVLMVADIESPSKNVELLIASVENLVKLHKTKVFKCALQDIKRACCEDKADAKEFYVCLQEQYPEFSFIESQRLNQRAYYGKLFEAVGAVKSYFAEL